MERWSGEWVAIAAILIGGVAGIKLTVQVMEMLPLEPRPVIDCACVPMITTVHYYPGDPGPPISPPLPPE